MANRTLIRGVTITAIATCAALAIPPAAHAVGAPAAAVVSSGPAVLTGTSPSGGTWEGRVPADWNGTVLLYSHGFSASSAWDNRMQPVWDAVMARGYAVLSSSFESSGWVFDTAIDDQLDALAQFSEQFAEPTETIAIGRSMGGLVTAMLAEVPGADLDGALAMCGLVAGGVALNNYQLDAAWAAAVLLAEDPDLQLTGFLTSAEAAPTAAVIREAILEALETPEGRARVELVAALLHAPQTFEGVDPDDAEAMRAARADAVLGTLPTVLSRRGDIVMNAGGDSGWNTGVNYSTLLAQSSQAASVRAAYKAAGLTLAKDLRTLTVEADIQPDTDGLAWMEDYSNPTGDIQVPVLSTHTLNDTLAPVEHEDEYAETIRQAGKQKLHAQAFVARDGHCNYTVSEWVAGIEAVDERIATGSWKGLATTAALTAASAAAGIDDYAWVDHTVGEFVSDRVFTGR